MTPEEQQFLNKLHDKIVNAVEAGFSSALSVQGRQSRQAPGGFGANQTQMSKAANSLSNLDTAATKVTKTFYQLQKTLVAVNANFRNLSRAVPSGKISSLTPPPAPPPPSPPISPSLPAVSTGPNIDQLRREQDRVLHRLGLSEWTFLGRATQKLGMKFGLLASASTTLYNALANIGGPIAEDFFKLSARGMDASAQLLSLSKNAAMAGMSLQEYLSLMDDAAQVIVRSNSFDEFNNRLETSSKSLRALGVFGATARQLSSQMMISATSLGLPQAQFEGVMDQQVTLFKQLRASTLMLPEAFGDLLKTVSANENVQQELQGLAPKERAARYMQLVQLAALGSKMGLAAEQAKELANTMLAQRKASVEERFKAAGTVRMAAGMAGLGAQEAEELARFAQIKNVSALSAEQQQRYVQLAGRMEQGLQAMMNTGQIGSEYIAEQFQGMFPPQLRQMMETTAKAVSVTESGDVKNTKQFGVEVGKFGQAVGSFLESVSGLQKSRFWEIMTGAATTFMAGVALYKLHTISKSLRGATGDTSTPFRTALDSAHDKSKNLMFSGSGKLAKFGNFLLTGGPIASGIDLISSFAEKAPKIGGVLGGIGKITKLLFSGTGIFSFFFDAIGEAFTGNVAAAFGSSDWVGRIGNIVWAGVTGLLGGFFDLLDVAWTSIFDSSLRNYFDRLTTWIREKFNWVMQFFTWGDVDEWFRKGEQNASKLGEELKKDSKSTVSSIGERIQAENSTKSAVLDANKATTETNKQLAESLKATASAAVGASTLAANAKMTAAMAVATTTTTDSVIASPAQAPAPTPINANVATQAATSDKSSEGTPDDMMAILRNSLKVQRQMAEYLQKIEQKEPASSVVVNNVDSKTAAAQFTNNVALANVMLAQGGYATGA